MYLCVILKYLNLFVTKNCWHFSDKIILPMILLLVTIIFIYTGKTITQLSDTCGIEQSSQAEVLKTADIETYPWMGLLIYRFGVRPNEETSSSTLVLVSRQLALATALEIDKFPKHDFRENSRVVLGHNCSGPYIRVLEYTFHPDFSAHYYSALAMVQLEVTAGQDYVPICAPPAEFENPRIYAMTIAHDCTTPMLRLYEMKYVDLNLCSEYYRRNDLDIQSLWPKHVACAQSLHGGQCLWRSGTVLVSKQFGRWRLLGIGVYGPGCEAPARFLDYNMYEDWVKKSLRRMGKVAVTRIASNHLIIRRSGSKIQRFGYCDPEEKQYELYTEHTRVKPGLNILHDTNGYAKYNLTIFSATEYSCIIIRAKYVNNNATEFARLYLRRWCHSKTPVCYETQYSTIFLYVEIFFVGELVYKVNVFGKSIKKINVKTALFRINMEVPYPQSNSNLEEFNPYLGMTEKSNYWD